MCSALLADCYAEQSYQESKTESTTNNIYIFMRGTLLIHFPMVVQDYVPTMVHWRLPRQSAGGQQMTITMNDYGRSAKNLGLYRYNVKRRITYRSRLAILSAEELIQAPRNDPSSLIDLLPVVISNSLQQSAKPIRMPFPKSFLDSFLRGLGR